MVDVFFALGGMGDLLANYIYYCFSSSAHFSSSVPIILSGIVEHEVALFGFNMA
jgi:hypothetical protein